MIEMYHRNIEFMSDLYNHFVNICSFIYDENRRRIDEMDYLNSEYIFLDFKITRAHTQLEIINQQTIDIIKAIFSKKEEPEMFIEQCLNEIIKMKYRMLAIEVEHTVRRPVRQSDGLS